MRPDIQIKSGSASNSRSAKARILVVEDDPATNQYICEALARDYRTESAFDGREALAKATHVHPDLIVTDEIMPKMSGGRLVHAIRDRPELDLVPIIILSAKTDDELRVRLLREGAQDYIMKPFSAEELCARVTNLVALKRVREELVGQNESLKRLTTDLKAANKDLEAFSYSVSHDLRAPLRRIENYSSLLESDYKVALDGAGKKLVDSIRNQAGRMDRLIDDLLNFARLGRRPMQSKAVDMTRLARTVFQELASVSKPSPRLELRPLPHARADESLVRQVVTNLLSNAIKFSRHREVSWIEVGGQTEGGHNTYYVKDNGAGFDERHLDKLFGVFQRLHPESEFEGTGVGLALVQRIIQRHGGRIWARAKVNEGATFHFTLPAWSEAN
ncbi:MAG: response regulator [Verrucomicrobia bacterium]|nr:response regulator [Verrucomicrobiota bacterium]